MPKKKKQKNYEIGYGKPPKDTRFKKGQSGNPKGRPKRSRNLTTLIREELERKVVLTENGKQYTMTKAEAMTKRLVAQALNGHMSAMKTLIGMSGDEEDKELLFHVSNEDQAVLQNYIEKSGYQNKKDCGE